MPKPLHRFRTQSRMNKLMICYFHVCIESDANKNPGHTVSLIVCFVVCSNLRTWLLRSLGRQQSNFWTNFQWNTKTVMNMPAHPAVPPTPFVFKNVKSIFTPTMWCLTITCVVQHRLNDFPQHDSLKFHNTFLDNKSHNGTNVTFGCCSSKNTQWKITWLAAHLNEAIVVVSWLYVFRYHRRGLWEVFTVLVDCSVASALRCKTVQIKFVQRWLDWSLFRPVHVILVQNSNQSGCSKIAR